MGSCPSSEVLMEENQSPEPSVHHFAPNLGKHPFPISRRGTPTSDLRGPEGPRAEREKLTRASPSRAREVYSRQWPGVLAPPPALAYEEEVPNATAAREQQPKPPPPPQLRLFPTSPGVAGDWRAASPHHTATLRRCQPPPS